MSVEKYFVAIDAAGVPVAQRTTLRDRAYQSASRSGSFSSKKISASHPLRVVEVPRAIEWVTRASLISGKIVSARSRMCAPGRNYLLYVHVVPTAKSHESVYWTNETAEQAIARLKKRGDQFLIFVEGTLEIRHWPTPGNSVVI